MEKVVIIDGTTDNFINHWDHHASDNCVLAKLLCFASILLNKRLNLVLQWDAQKVAHFAMLERKISQHN